jgi:type IV pilus assembly protein PilE
MTANSQQLVRTSRGDRERGFTLIDMMIAVVVIAILLAVALPSYQEHMRKARRAAAQSHLMDLAQRQQQYLLDARGYAPDLATLGITTPSDVLAFYQPPVIATPVGVRPTFTLTIIPKVGTSQVPDGPLSIDNAGVKTPADKW